MYLKNVTVTDDAGQTQSNAFKGSFKWVNTKAYSENPPIARHVALKKSKSTRAVDILVNGQIPVTKSNRFGTTKNAFSIGYFSDKKSKLKLRIACNITADVAIPINTTRGNQLKSILNAHWTFIGKFTWEFNN